MNVLVLGISGMLGSMIFQYLSKNSELNLFGTTRQRNIKRTKINLFFDANNITELKTPQLKDLNIDFIINCIGITNRFCSDDNISGIRNAIKINAEFPWLLSDYANENNIKVIQIATDCVFSGKDGNYVEDSKHDPLDVYGKSKSLGEVKDKSTIIIRSSIIGPESNNKGIYLLDWFLHQSQGAMINGYAHHNWNGVTTLQFAQLCEKIILSNQFDYLTEVSNIHHFVPNEIVTKYQLLNFFKDIFRNDLQINKIIGKETIDRTLKSNFNELSKIIPFSGIKKALFELK